MTYAVKEIHYTLQGEGASAGTAAVLLRFSGCNLWTGREEDRATAICRFCDTDFVGTDGLGGGKYAGAGDLADAVDCLWPASDDARRVKLVLCTGGEPLLQLDAALVTALHERGFHLAVETNGTIAAPDGVDWICVSPKAGAPLLQTTGDELKLVYPQEGVEPEDLAGLCFKHFFLQPRDGPSLDKHMRMAVRYCLGHPRWRLSIQAHKIIGIP